MLTEQGEEFSDLYRTIQSKAEAATITELRELSAMVKHSPQ